MDRAEATHHVDPGQRLNTRVFICPLGYTYHSNRVVTGTIYLRCKRYPITGCRGKAVLLLPAQQLVYTSHHRLGCYGDPDARAVRLLREELLDESRANAYENPRSLVLRVSIRYPLRVAARVRQANYRTSMRRARMENFPLIPETRDELGDLLSSPDHRHLTASVDNVDNIFCAAVGPPGHRSVIFMARRMGAFLESVGTVFVDATFMPTPAQGSQVYQIVTVVQHKVIPIVQVIMTRKTYEAYHAILSKLMEVVPRFQPRRAIMDFEVAEMHAWMDVYNTKVIGCYVHYVRANLRKVRELGLIPAINRSRRVKSLIYCTLAIPLLPKGVMKRGLRSVMRSAALRPVVFNVLKNFFYYYVTTWMTGTLYQTVSVFGEVQRTNNACESAHSLLQVDSGPRHPSIWTFLGHLRKYEFNAAADVSAYQQGLPFGGRRRVSSTINDLAIRRDTTELMEGNLTILRFLRRGAARMQNLVEHELRLN